jgi:diacylglycerol kinase family enzyme
MTRKSELAIVLNPAAQGGAYDDRRIKSLRAIAGSRAVIFSTERRDLTDAVAEGVRERGAETVAVIGGDGTISNVLTALHRAYGEQPLPRIALLRGGTMNTTANAFDVPRRQPEELLRQLLAARAETIVARATLKVQGRLGFLFSTGAMVGFLDALYETRAAGQGSSLRALSLLARGSWSALTGGEGPLLSRIETPLLAAARVDGEEHPAHRYTLFAAGTVESIGLGFRPFPRAAECQSEFQLFAFHASLQTLARQLSRIRRGQPIANGLGYDPLAKRVELDAQGSGFRYALDGDIYESGDKLAVEAGPRIEIRVA